MSIASGLSAAPQRYFAWLGSCAPETAGQLRGPASEAELIALETRIGLRLPEDVRALYQLHDGQDEAVRLGVIYGLEFLTLSGIGREWDTWREVRDDPGYDPQDFDPYEDVFEPGLVQKAYTTPGWIPLFRCPGRSDYIGVDLNPAEHGSIGQVVNFGRDEPKKYAASKGLEDFFTMLSLWGEAESRGGDPSVTKRHIEDLFGHGGLVFERLHARASGKQVTLTEIPGD